MKPSLSASSKFSLAVKSIVPLCVYLTVDDDFLRKTKYSTEILWNKDKPKWELNLCGT